MKLYLAFVSVLVVAGLMLAGCGGNGGQADAKAFDQALPEIKADWDAALAADKANDFFTASVAYGKVLRQESKLTPKQFESLQTASRAMSQRMINAADAGDPAAKAALAKLMAAQRR